MISNSLKSDKNTNFRKLSMFAVWFALLVIYLVVMARTAISDENASNPLAKVKNTDIRWHYLSIGGAHVNDMFIDGAFMAHDKLKVKYELHYWETDTSGSSDHGLESVSAKGIYFPAEGVRGDLKYRLALGLEWIKDLGDQDKGIGTDADVLSPFGGIALGLESNTTLIPLVQQFWNYSGQDVNITAFRLIAMQPIQKQMWLKLDAKISIDWENNNDIPASAELQLGKNINKNIALYADGLVGIGGDSYYDWGVGMGLRFKY